MNERMNEIFFSFFLLQLENIFIASTFCHWIVDNNENTQHEFRFFGYQARGETNNSLRKQQNISSLLLNEHWDTGIFSKHTYQICLLTVCDKFLYLSLSLSFFLSYKLKSDKLFSDSRRFLFQSQSIWWSICVYVYMCLYMWIVEGKFLVQVDRNESLLMFYLKYLVVLSI